MVNSTGCSSRDLGPISLLSTHGAVCNSSPRGSHPLFWLPQALGTHLAYRYTCRQNICTYLINKLIFFEWRGGSVSQHRALGWDPQKQVKPGMEGQSQRQSGQTHGAHWSAGPEHLLGSSTNESPHLK